MVSSRWILGVTTVTLDPNFQQSIQPQPKRNVLLVPSSECVVSGATRREEDRGEGIRMLNLWSTIITLLHEKINSESKN